MSLKSNLNEIESSLSGLLSYANSVTGNNDISIGDAIYTLGNGFGGSDMLPYGGEEPVLLKSFTKIWTNADFGFDFTTATTSSQPIRVTSSNVDDGAITTPDSPTIDLTVCDLAIKQRVVVIPTYGSDTSGKIYAKGFVAESVYYVASRPSSRTESGDDVTYKYSRNLVGLSNYLYNYVASSGANSYAVSATYGVNSTLQVPSLSTTTSSSAYVKINTPTVYCRASGTYCSLDNMKKISDINVTWNVDIYKVKRGTTPYGKMVDDMIGDLP